MHLVVAQALGHEALLPRLQRQAFAVQRRLDERGRCHIIVVVDLVEYHFAPVATSVHLADHRLWQWSCGVPQEVELVLNPGHTLGRLVFPKDLVVALPAVAGFVHRSDEAQLAPVGQLDDAGLPMHKPAHAVGRDAHCLAVPLQEGIQPSVAVPVQQCLGLDGLLVPAAHHACLAQLGHLEVVRVDVDIADDAHVRNAFQQLVRYLEQRTGEIARDAPVAARAFQVLQQKAGIQPVRA